MKNGGFGLTLTNPLYKLYTVMSVQINPRLFILDQGQKSHLQLFHVAESQQIVFRTSSLYSSTGRRRSNTLSVCNSDTQHCTSQTSSTSLQKKRVSLMLCCVVGPWKIRSASRGTDQLFLSWWDSTSASNGTLTLHKLWHSSDPLVTKPEEK